MSPTRETTDSAPLTPVRLRYRRQELLLTLGSYLLGRDPSCHVVIDRALVSRRHARIAVDRNRVTIEDLGSMNGVYVNGERIEGTRDLFDGDWVTIANEELELAIGESGRTRIPVETQADPSKLRPSSEQEVEKLRQTPPQDERPTERSRTLEILSAIADRAFESNRVQDAEDMLKMTLLDLLSDANSGLPLEADAHDFAVSYGLKLAAGSGKARWFDFVIDLLKAVRTPCTAALARELSVAMKRVPEVDVGRLRAYANSLRTLTSNLESLRSNERVEELVREAESRRG